MRIPVIPTSTRLLATKTSPAARRAKRPGGGLLGAVYQVWMLRVPFVPMPERAETMPLLSRLTSTLTGTSSTYERFSCAAEETDDTPTGVHVRTSTVRADVGRDVTTHRDTPAFVPED